MKILGEILIIGIIIFGIPYLVFSIGQSNFNLTITPAPQCSDGIDNDLDGKIDYPEDANCDNESDNNESGPIITPIICGDNTCSSSENCLSCSTDCGNCPVSGGGGGSSINVIPTASVLIQGVTSPYSKVFILKDSVRISEVSSGQDGRFVFSSSGYSTQNYIFSLYSEDEKNRRSPLFSTSLDLNVGETKQLDNIVLSPTFQTDKKEVKKGDIINFFGQTTPSSEIELVLDNNQKFKTKSDNSGNYSFEIKTDEMDFGKKTAKAKVYFGSLISSYGESITFTIGTKNTKETIVSKGDFNNDQRTNIVDFSILAYWYKKPSPPVNIDLNGDGIITLIDLSILAFYWTG